MILQVDITGSRLTKIGISYSATLRLQNLQAWVPEPLSLIWTHEGPQHVIRRVEAACHAQLAAARVFSEWFDIHSDLAVEIVRKHLKVNGIL
jgi:hypothetical protein